jgi:hypothetical protein
MYICNGEFVNITYLDERQYAFGRSYDRPPRHVFKQILRWLPGSKLLTACFSLSFHHILIIKSKCRALPEASTAYHQEVFILILTLLEGRAGKFWRIFNSDAISPSRIKVSFTSPA